MLVTAFWEAVLGKPSLIALTNPLEGRDDEFNEWYMSEHPTDAFKLPGNVAAQRYKLRDIQHRSGPLERKYMAVYERDIEDVSESLNALAAASGTDAMKLSPAVSPERMVWIYQPITDRIEAPVEPAE